MTALTIRQRDGNDWQTVTLTPATLSRDIWSTMLHGQTGQELSDGWLDAGTTVHVARPGAHRHPFCETPHEIDEARDFVYDDQGMQHRIRHADWDALQEVWP